MVRATEAAWGRDRSRGPLWGRPFLWWTLLLASAVHAAPWARNYAGNAFDEYGIAAIQQTADGGYVVAGAGGVGGLGHGWLAKLNPGGEITWQKRIALSDPPQNVGTRATAVQQTADGGYVAAGFATEVVFNVVYEEHLWVAKFDAAGNSLWQLSGDFSLDSEAYAIRQTLDGGYIVAGVAAYPGGGGALILKLDASGKIVWGKIYGGNAIFRLNAIQQTADGGYIAAGTFLTSPGGGAWVLKVDASGGAIWEKTYATSGFDFGTSVQQTADGGYIVAQASGYSTWLLKLDQAGNTSWQMAYGGTGTFSAPSMQQTSDGGYILAGATTPTGAGDGHAWFLKTDAAGAILWQRTFGGAGGDAAAAVQQTADGGYVAAGYTTSFGPIGGSSAWVLKLDGAGNGAGCPYLSGAAAIATVGNANPTAVATNDTSTGTLFGLPMTIDDATAASAQLCPTVAPVEVPTLFPPIAAFLSASFGLLGIAATAWRRAG